MNKIGRGCQVSITPNNKYTHHILKILFSKISIFNINKHSFSIFIFNSSFNPNSSFYFNIIFYLILSSYIIYFIYISKIFKSYRFSYFSSISISLIFYLFILYTNTSIYNMSKFNINNISILYISSTINTTNHLYVKSC